MPILQIWLRMTYVVNFNMIYNKNICSFHSNQVRGHFYNLRKILGGHS